MEIDGEHWEVSIGNQKSGLEPRPHDDVQSLYEYRVNAYGHGERKLPLLIQPRLAWKDERRPKSVPRDLGLATNVKLETAVNLEPEEIEQLIPQIMTLLAQYAGVSWNPDYFTETPHEYSTITQYERYYRVERGQARKIIRSDGIFHRIFHLLADYEGSKVVYSADNTEIIGYNHQIRLDRSGAKELLEGRQRGKQFKHYHPQHVRGSDSGDPLYHPKIGCLFKKKWNNELRRYKYPFDKPVPESLPEPRATAAKGVETVILAPTWEFGNNGNCSQTTSSGPRPGRATSSKSASSTSRPTVPTATACLTALSPSKSPFLMAMRR